MSLHLETPLVPSRPISLAGGQDVWLKLDALQPCGSFKLRGVGLACQAHARQGKRRFVSSSGGNAGIAVAYAGRPFFYSAVNALRLGRVNMDVPISLALILAGLLLFLSREEEA